MCDWGGGPNEIQNYTDRASSKTSSRDTEIERPLTHDEMEALDTVLDVIVLTGATSDIAPYITHKAEGFLAALAGVDPPLTVVPLRSQPASEPSLDVAWRAAEAALPLAGWMSADGRWVLPSGVWDINVRRFPASGDNVTEPYYPDMYEATATVSPNKRFAGTPEESPAAALQALAARLSQPTEPSETDQE